MDTQTTQAFGNENKKNQEENKNMKWAKAAKAAGTTAAVAGVGGLAASVLGGEESSVADIELQEELLANVDAAAGQEMQEARPETVESQTHESVSTNAAESVKSAPQSQPAAEVHHDVASAAAQEVQHDDTSVPVEATAQTHVESSEIVADENGLPVDTQWLADSVTPAETAPSENSDVAAEASPALNQELPPLSQSAMNILSSGVDDDLADTVNVSPEIFMSMMGLKPADMVQTELNGDGQSHMAALLANDNGQFMLLVDSDGDGFLDTLTDMTGHEYAMLGDGIRFEVSVGDMKAFVHEINPETMVDTPMYASSGADIASIEGNGNGDEVAYVDENDIIDSPAATEVDASLETSQESVDNSIFDDLEASASEDLAANDTDVNTDLIGFDDTSMA